VNWCLAEG